ncbi:MAG: class I SAM-dependent methyltransferase [Actinomycetes bacterium]
MTGTATPVRKFTDLPGWFFWIDYLVFTRLLQAQQASPPGVLVELGTYLGKSAVVIGEHLRDRERFVALDLFGRTELLDGDGTSANTAEVQRSYPTLSRRAFEANYLALHPALPEIVEGLSSSIPRYVTPGTARFVHVDASHLYDQVQVDVGNTEQMLRPGGVAVFDDWRSEHTPGVAAAVWEAVFTRGLIPLVLTPYKFYGVWSDPEPYRSAIARLIDQDPAVWAEQQQIAGYPVFRLSLRR